MVIKKVLKTCIKIVTFRRDKHCEWRERWFTLIWSYLSSKTWIVRIIFFSLEQEKRGLNHFLSIMDHKIFWPSFIEYQVFFCGIECSLLFNNLFYLIRFLCLQYPPLLYLLQRFFKNQLYESSNPKAMHCE